MLHDRLLCAVCFWQDRQDSATGQVREVHIKLEIQQQGEARLQGSITASLTGDFSLVF